MAKLGDICTNQSSNIKQGDLETLNGDYPIYGASGFIKNVDFYKQDKPYVAVVKDGAGIGRVMKLPAYSSIIGTMQYIIPNDDTDVNYLAYAMEHMNLSKYFTGATIPHIYFKDYKNEPIKEHDYKTQKQIAANLDKVTRTIDICNAILEKLDLLVKARFVEMFGEPILNPKGWDMVKIGDIVTEVKYGTSKPAVDGGKYPYLRMNNLTYDGHLDLTDLKRIDIPDNEIEKCIVRKGDVLFNRTNSVELVGKTCVFDEDEDMIIAGYIIRVRLKPVMLPIVLSCFMNTDALKKKLRDMAKGAVNQANINAQELQAINIYLPPLELQQQFAAFVAQTDKSKSAVKQVLEKAETLKKALMQEYFG
jgi:type I restriction enzyme S subunit